MGWYNPKWEELSPKAKRLYVLFMILIVCLVVFIMLIFFIVTATFIKLPGADVTRSETDNAISRKPSMVVAITENNDIWINREKISLKFLRTNIALLLADNPNGELIIQADAGSDIKNVASVWDAAKDVGVQFISISGENK